MRARYYVPGVGRFASADTIVPDPENPQSLSRYSYTFNNPIRFTDPSGHRCQNREYDYADEERECYEMEQEILASTVQIYVVLIHHKETFEQQQVLFHGTIMDGSRILTHNHFRYKLSSGAWEIGEIALFDSNGKQIYYAESVEGIDVRTLNHGHEPDVLTITLDGSPLSGYSNSVIREGSVSRELVGEEVAVINRRLADTPTGRKTTVEWATVTGLYHFDRIESPTQTRFGRVTGLQVDVSIDFGASGGGVFGNFGDERLVLVGVNSSHDADGIHSYASFPYSVWYP